MGKTARIVAGIATLGASEIGLTLAGALSPGDPSDPRLPDPSDDLAPANEDAKRAEESEKERRRRRQSRLKRVFTGPQGVLVGETNLGKARLLGQ